jgi:hypothetical protein
MSRFTIRVIQTRLCEEPGLQGRDEQRGPQDLTAQADHAQHDEALVRQQNGLEDGEHEGQPDVHGKHCHETRTLDMES